MWNFRKPVNTEGILMEVEIIKMVHWYNHTNIQTDKKISRSKKQSERGKTENTTNCLRGQFNTGTTPTSGLSSKILKIDAFTFLLKYTSDLLLLRSETNIKPGLLLYITQDSFLHSVCC